MWRRNVSKKVDNNRSALRSRKMKMIFPSRKFTTSSFSIFYFSPVTFPLDVPLTTSLVFLCLQSKIHSRHLNKIRSTIVARPALVPGAGTMDGFFLGYSTVCSATIFPDDVVCSFFDFDELFFQQKWAWIFWVYCVVLYAYHGCDVRKKNAQWWRPLRKVLCIAANCLRFVRFILMDSLQSLLNIIGFTISELFYDLPFTQFYSAKSSLSPITMDYSLICRFWWNRQIAGQLFSSSAQPFQIVCNQCETIFYVLEPRYICM